LIVIGKVRRPHGLRGLLLVESYAESWESFKKVETVFLTDAANHLRQYRVISAKPHKRLVLLELEGIDSMEGAESVRHSDVFADKKAFKKTGDNEFFWFELLGLEVYHENGTYLGQLSQIIPTPANDVYVVTNKGREYLIPAIVEIVREVDLKQGKMIVSPLDGMLEINED